MSGNKRKREGREKKCQVCGKVGLKDEDNLMTWRFMGNSFHSSCLESYIRAEAMVKARIFELIWNGSIVQQKTSSAGHINKEAMVDEVFEDISRHYGDQSRFYHTLIHIADLLNQSAEARQKKHPYALQNAEIIDWAILYHDIIYDATSTTNEEDSAVFFRKWATKCSEEKSGYMFFIPGYAVDKICHYIIETKKHDVALSNDTDLQFFIDIDMSILGRADSSEYLAYCDKIRLEYCHLSDEEWRIGRTSFLRSTLEKGDAIFASPAMRALLEGNAKRNMQLEMAQLGV